MENLLKFLKNSQLRNYFVQIKNIVHSLVWNISSNSLSDMSYRCMYSLLSNDVVSVKRY